MELELEFDSFSPGQSSLVYIYDSNRGAFFASVYIIQYQLHFRDERATAPVYLVVVYMPENGGRI